MNTEIGYTPKPKKGVPSVGWYVKSERVTGRKKQDNFKLTQQKWVEETGEDDQKDRDDYNGKREDR